MISDICLVVDQWSIEEYAVYIPEHVPIDNVLNLETKSSG